MKHLPTENKIPRRGVVPCPSTAEVVLLAETFRFPRSFTDKMFELVTASKAGSSFKTWHISATAKRLELPHPLAGCVALVPEGRAGPPITDEKPLFEPLSQGPEATPPEATLVRRGCAARGAHPYPHGQALPPPGRGVNRAKGEV